ncbi:hypothetical protein BCV70DRAFT_201025 [Testicularia cyperi]|uniref:Uncharacterized protein n=1 Tax=Testicularia cyperi TaxID=1882483 RepID=A0A317XQ38_9BASI|nr:hypothetical protein BCV70DRAFT_201025 [Testicularia cyperi]
MKQKPHLPALPATKIQNQNQNQKPEPFTFSYKLDPGQIDDLKLEGEAQRKPEVAKIDIRPQRDVKKGQRGQRQPWTKEELKALLDMELEVAKENAARLLSHPALSGRSNANIHIKLAQRHAAAIKALKDSSI